ncbi:MAG: hypothetical protein HAW67_07805 [Endozoicomonadaceae bacterium]|nr:hypothetical protein [Endozoicomonadaceae bacterium]
MKLQYKILWFEDQFEGVEGDINRLESLVREYGFLPEIVRRTKISEVEIDSLSSQLDNYNPYDIIILDYNLGDDSANGLSIATKLRATIYTDMVFYSGSVPKELRRYLFEKDVDGVFVVGRDNFFDDIEPIIEDHIKRMSDINNMRGVVMSATSSMDVSLRDILTGKIASLDTEQTENIFRDLKNRLKKNLIKQQNKIEAYTSLDAVVNNHFLTSFDVVRITLKSLFDAESRPYSVLNNDAIIHNVQKERNKLAHQRDEYTQDGKLILHGQNESVVYDFDAFIRIRNELLEAMENIRNIINRTK